MKEENSSNRDREIERDFENKLTLKKEDINI